MPRMDEKKLHTREFQLKSSSRNMRCKLLQKRFTGKTTECSKHLRHIAIEKDILSELNRCIFQISLKYIKLVIPKILFILVLCIFNFYFKITWPHSPPNKIKISVSAIKERLKKVSSVPNECVRLGLLLNKNKKSQKCGFQFEEINWLNVPDQCIWLLWGKILSCWTYLFFTQL